MYKVKYYTLAKTNDGTIGNCEQFRDTYYTEYKIEDIPNELQKVLDNKYCNSKNKFVPVIMGIESITGHGEREYPIYLDNGGRVMPIKPKTPKNRHIKDGEHPKKDS